MCLAQNAGAITCGLFLFVHVGNKANDDGGGIRCRSGCNAIITNTIFWADTAGSDPEIDGTPVVTYCDIEGGWTGEGNISCDPQFCYPDTGNYYLLDTSCCVGASEGGVDIGAFGVGCWSYVCGDANADSTVDVVDVVYLINYLFDEGSAPVHFEAGDANSDGKVNVDDIVYLINYLFSGGGPPPRE